MARLDCRLSPMAGGVVAFPGECRARCVRAKVCVPALPIHHSPCSDGEFGRFGSRGRSGGRLAIGRCGLEPPGTKPLKICGLAGRGAGCMRRSAGVRVHGGSRRVDERREKAKSERKWPLRWPLGRNARQMKKVGQPAPRDQASRVWDPRARGSGLMGQGWAGLR